MRVAGYEFRDGAHFQAGAVRNAKEVGEHLAVLRDHHDGELTPRDVVDDARNKNSPLHSFFEWDNGTAAEAYRLSQARGLIRSVVAVYDVGGEEDLQTVKVAAFSHIEGVGEPHYRDTVAALSEAETREAVLQRALRDLNSWRRRYGELSELAEVVKAADTTSARIAQKRA